MLREDLDELNEIIKYAKKNHYDVSIEGDVVNIVKQMEFIEEKDDCVDVIGKRIEILNTKISGQTNNLSQSKVIGKKGLKLKGLKY